MLKLNNNFILPLAFFAVGLILLGIGGYVEKGVHIPLFYNPDASSITPTISDYLFLLTLLFLASGGIFFVIAAFWMARDAKCEEIKEYLAIHGVGVPGTVDSIVFAGRAPGQIPHATMHYRFVNPVDGTTIHGKSRWFAEDMLLHYKVGDEIRVLYNPEEPKHHCWAEEVYRDITREALVS